MGNRLEMFMTVFVLYALMATALTYIQAALSLESGDLCWYFPTETSLLVSRTACDLFLFLAYLMWAMYSAILINDRVFKQSSALLRQQMKIKEAIPHMPERKR